MTYVVKRPKRRFEIRESVATPAGPRARTLATFRELDDEALARAAAAATTGFDAPAVRKAARRAGAPIKPPAADLAARRLLRELRRGSYIKPALRRLLLDALAQEDAPSVEAGDIADWIDATAVERGIALRELLDLADRLPGPRRASKLAFPRLAPHD